MAGIHRSSTLVSTEARVYFGLGMAGIHRSSTLGRAELAEKQQVGAVFLFKKEGFGRECLQDRVVFFRKIPPSCQTDDPLQSSTAPVPAAG